MFETKDNLEYLNKLITDATDNTTLSDEIIARNKKLIWILRGHVSLIERIKEYLLFFSEKPCPKCLSETKRESVVLLVMNGTNLA